MKVAILHNILSQIGGGERVAISLIEALNKMDVVPDVYTVAPIEFDEISLYFGKIVKFKQHKILPIRPKIFGIYQRLINSFATIKFSKYDVVVNTMGAYLPIFVQKSLRRYILYIYNPTIPEKYQLNLFWKIYYIPYLNIINYSAKKLDSIDILAVSEFTRKRIKVFWNKDSITVYPPVDIDMFLQVFENKDRDGVISIGRFTKEKRHEIQLKIAKTMPDVIFRICGSAKVPLAKAHYEKIRAKAEQLNLKNVEFYPNISIKRLIDLIGSSKYFLHTMINEDFGITTCEAIAGGCIPCVHNSGGQVEIVPFRQLRFNNIEEATCILKKPFHNRHSLLSNIKRFSENNFQETMLKVIGLVH